MSEYEIDSIKRAALLKQIGITGVATLAGVVAVEGKAGSQSPYNLYISNSDAVDAEGKKHHFHASAAVDVSTIQIVGTLDDAVYVTGWDYKIFGMKPAWIHGSDEQGTEHGNDDGNSGPKKKKLKYGFYAVIGSPTKITC